MSWINKNLLKNFINIGLISLILLTIVNFAAVYFLPTLIRHLPQNFARAISPCYRTLFHYDGSKVENINFVFGDSFSEGSGSEFLQGDIQYGIFNKLVDSEETELIFGRGGYGNIGTVVEYERCKSLLTQYTNFSLDTNADYAVTFVFYEGNDLNNNLVEAQREYNEFSYHLKFFFPVFHFAYNIIRGVWARVYKRLNIATYSSVDADLPPFPVTTAGVQIGRFPQSAATELTANELKLSVNLLKDSLQRISEILPNARQFRFLYLPSVASSYRFDGDLFIQSYKGLPYHQTTGDFNYNRSQTLREHIAQINTELGWGFCDSTSEILDLTASGLAVHGPTDWKHFNKSGYEVVAGVYEQCFRN